MDRHNIRDRLPQQEIFSSERVTDWIKHYYSTLPNRTTRPPKGEEMYISRLLDGNKEPLTETEIRRGFGVIEISADKLADYTNLYLEYKTKEKYQNEWNNAQSLNKNIIYIWSEMNIHAFRDNKCIYVGTNVRELMDHSGIPKKEQPKIYEIKEGNEYGGRIYLGNKIEDFDIKNNKLEFLIERKILRPVEYTIPPNNGNEDKRAVYFSDNYQETVRYIDPSASWNISLLYTMRKNTDFYTSNNINGFVRWDQERVDQERANQISS